MPALWKTRGLWPYVMVAFLNAFVDLGHKITIQNTVFKVYDGSLQVVLTSIVNALILLPFVLLFRPAGLWSDRYPKNQVMRVSAWIAVVITLLITYCYYQGWFWLAFVMTLVLAMQSAIYSPAKYGYIKVLLGKEWLASGNGLIQATTIVAILAGTLVFSSLFEYWFARSPHADADSIVMAIAPLGWLLVLSSVIEVLLAYRLPLLETPARGEHEASLGTVATVRSVMSRPSLKYPMIGTAVFWTASQVVLAAFPAFAKELMSVTDTVKIQGAMAVSGIGIVAGSLLAARWSRHSIETGVIPLGAVGLALCLWWLPAIDSMPLHAFNFFLVGLFGALFIVPLNAVMQFNAGDRELGSVLSISNLVQNVAMLFFLGVTATVAYFGLPTLQLLYAIAIGALVGGCFTVIKMPQTLTRWFLALVSHRHYHLDVVGVEHIPEQGSVVLQGQFKHWYDGLIVRLANPRPLFWLAVSEKPPAFRLLPALTRFLAGESVLVFDAAARSKLTSRLSRGEQVCIHEPVAGQLEGLSVVRVPFRLEYSSDRGLICRVKVIFQRPE